MLTYNILNIVSENVLLIVLPISLDINQPLGEQLRSRFVSCYCKFNGAICSATSRDR